VKYAPLMIVLILIVMLMAGPRRRWERTGEAILVTIGGLLLLAVLFGWILFRR
jgi:hypothetical protein